MVPWARLEALICPHYTRPKRGRPQMALSVMLRIYFIQQWYGLSDPGAEEALYGMHSIREFVGVELGRDPIPDETTILNFRHLLERLAKAPQPAPRCGSGQGRTRIPCAEMSVRIP